jgi:uncharacterized membrane protein YdjX (TVP38/TMEM64 family)
MAHWKYKNLTFLVFSLVLAYFVLRNETLHSYLLHLGNLGNIGAFFAGILFVSTFTIATGAVILLILAETLSPVEIGLIAGLGAVVGDFAIFRFVKDDLAREIKQIYSLFDRNHHAMKVLHTRYFSWTLPVVGAIIIASPLPDEIGVSLMGISKLKAYQFLLISFILNSIGIFLVVSASFVIKP